ncbi:putative zinc protease AlbF [Clostridium liquoris]|jgi:predicted Zn-dependent peptidase|uniref:Putative zinc protease AlbF n=1 Tax=Clostridium liquoris TaxID=1289519 RepID=A0A2T0B057_9CLOT|nr:pitrilysin family protein [Clostridium liquoris]PRR76902.1 putative zinc protease AlbF [Clostridium liquoris]
MFQSKRDKLFNGIELISVKKDTQIFSIHIGIKVGSLYEKSSERGISHFIEHMLFKGTNNRDNERLNNELEALGGEYNAYTDHNCTVFSITALIDELENSIELLSDMMKNSIFPKDEMKKEKGVILSEIRTSKDDIEDYSFNRINEIGFKNGPLKYDILGTEEHVNSFSRELLLDFYHRYYVPNNCYISIVSPYEHDYILEIINKYFEDWTPRNFIKNTVVEENNIPGIFTSYKSDIEQSTILYLFTFHNLDKHGELALKILNYKFGDSANSILFRKLREEKGLAYDVYTSIDTTNYVKSLYIYTAVGKENVEETIKMINSCIEDIKKENIVFDDSSINLMKKVLKTAVAFTLEDGTDLSNYILHQMIDGENIYAFIEDMKKIDDIKKEDIYDVGRKVLNNPTIHILKNQ